MTINIVIKFKTTKFDILIELTIGKEI